MAEGTANHPALEKGSDTNRQNESKDEIDNGTSSEGTSESPNVENIHRSFMFSLDGAKNFQFLFGGITRLLNNPHECVSAFLAEQQTDWVLSRAAGVVLESGRLQ